MIKYITHCRLCGHANLISVIDLGYNHIQGAFITKNNQFPPKRKIPNCVVRCDPKTGGCSLVQSNITVPPEILFSSYFYKSGINETMKNHLKSVVKYLLDFYPKPKKVLDIASNDLTLLRNYSSKVEKWGIDPNNIISQVDKKDINIINDFFPSDKLPQFIEFDIISILAVMYDLDDPIMFLRSAINKLSHAGVLCLEVMYLPSIINSLAWDTFLGEHLTHWSLYTIENLVKKSGGKVINAKLTSTNGGSILIFVSRENCNKYDNQENKDYILMLKKHEFDLGLDDQEIFDNFKLRVQQHQRDFKTCLYNLKTNGSNICLYGVSTKSNVLIESSQTEHYFSYGIERSEEKVGGKTLWGLPIRSEAEARSEINEKTVWVIGPYFFKENILKREKEMIDKGGSLLFPLPTLQIVNKSNYSQSI